MHDMMTSAISQTTTWDREELRRSKRSSSLFEWKKIGKFYEGNYEELFGRDIHELFPVIDTSSPIPIKQILKILELFESELKVGSESESSENVICVGVRQLFGELFRFEREEEYCYIVHPKWSLVGAGKSWYEAYADLIDNIRDAYEFFAQSLKDSDISLSSDAIEFVRFLKNVLTG